MKSIWGGFLVLVAAGVIATGASASEPAAPAWVAQQAFEFGAFDESTSADPIDTQQIAEQIAALEAAHEKRISLPAARAQRGKSLDAFEDLGSRAARRLLKDAFGLQLQVLTTLPTEPLLESESPVKFNSDTSARVDPPGPEDSLLVVSDAPLRNQDGEIVRGELASTGEGFEPVAPLAEVELPDVSSGEVLFPEVGVSFKFEDAGRSDGRLISAAEGDGKEMVFYANTDTDTDTAITYTATGIETFNYLRSEMSPETLGLDYTLPEGTSLSKTSDGGAVAVDEDGETLLTVYPPYALDAQGSFVPMSLAVEGDSIVLNVPHRGEDFAYPIMVDPVQHVRDWWNYGAYPGFEGWSFSEAGTTNYSSSTTCPSAVLPGDPCGGSGSGVYVSAQPGKTYPANSKGYWRWTAPGGASSSITEATLSSWRYRKGGASNGNPYAFFNLANTGSGFTTNAGGGGSGLTLSGSGNDTKYLHVGLASTSTTTLPSGSSNWRYNRLAGYSVSMTDGEVPSLSLSGAPAGWVGPGSSFSVTAGAHDPGLGMGWIWVVLDGQWFNEWNGVCTGTYGLTCPTWPVSTSVSFNANNFAEGITSVPFYASDIVGGSGHFAAQHMDARVDRTGPTIVTSGPLSTQYGADDELTVRIDDHALSNPTFDAGGNLTPAPSPADYPKLRSGAKEFKLYVDGQLVLTRSRTCSATVGSCRLGPEVLSPDLSGFADGSHEFRVVASDQVGNSTTSTWQKVLDRSAPVNESSKVPSTWQTGSEVVADVVASDDRSGISSIEVEDAQGLVAAKYLDCGGPSGCPSSFDGTVSINSDNLVDGRNTLEVFVVDRSGSRSEPKLILPEVDRDPAVIGSIEAPDWASTDASIEIAASNVGSGVAMVKIEDASQNVLASRQIDCSASCPSQVNETVSVDLAAVPEGSARNLTAVAETGAETRSEQSFQIGIERTAPSLVQPGGSLAALAGQHFDSNATETVATGGDDSIGSLNSGLSKIGVRDGVGGWQSEVDCSSANCSSASIDVALDELPDAKHSLEVFSVDRAGNETSEFIPFTLDRTGPEIAVGTSADPNEGVRDHGDDLDFWVSINDVPEESEGVASASVEVDGQPVSPEPCQEACTVDTYKVTNPGPGSHEVSVEATDALGHLSQLTTELLLDSDAPEIDLAGDLQEAAEVGSGVQELALTATDPGSGETRSGVSDVTVEIDGQSVREIREPCTTGDCVLAETYQFEEDELGMGTHEIRVTAMDQAGNSSEQAISVTRTCEASAPASVSSSNPVSPAAAVAGVETHHPDVVAASEPTEVNGKDYEPTLIEDPGHLNSDSTREPSELPNESEGATIVGQGGQAVCLVADSISDQADPAVVVNDDSAVYPNTAQDTDTVMRPTVSGVETFEILRSAAAPESFGWDLESPAGQTLSENPDGSVSVVMSGEELSVPERPDADPAYEGDAADLVQQGDLPPGTVDAMDDPEETTDQRLREEMSSTPGDAPVSAALPVGGPTGVPAAPQTPSIPLSAIPGLLDDLDESAEVEKGAILDEALSQYETVEAQAVDSSQIEAQELVDDEIEQIQVESVEIAKVEAPVATDALGQSVPVELGADGGGIEMAIDHAGASQSYDYPIAVDPFVTVWSTVIDWEPYPVYREEQYVSGSTVTMRRIGWWDPAYCKWINCSAEAKAGWFKVADRFSAWLPAGLASSDSGPLFESYYKPVLSTRTVFDRWEYKPVVRQVSSLDWEDPGAGISATLGVPSGWDRGMNFVGFDRAAFSAGAGNGSVDAARNQLGIKTAVLVPHWYTKTGNSSNIFRTGKTPTNSGLKDLARHARNQLDMKVVIKPHIDSLDETWRGQMNFGNRSAFWNDYSRIILDNADMADAVNAHGLVIGTELSRVQDDQPGKWRQLIGKVRNRFGGMLYYAANWDTIQSPNGLPDWFGLLDVIGVDYYRDNSSGKSPQGMWKDIVDVRKRFGKGMILTESGGNSRSGNQKLQYRKTNSAMLRGRNKSWFKGIWWYNRFTFITGGKGKTWNNFTPDQPTSKWLCSNQSSRSDGECRRLIERVW